MKSDLSMRKTTNQRSFIRKCHICGEIMESNAEIQKCHKCNKSYLPLNYFGKVHAKTSEEFRNLFADVSELNEEDVVKGLCVLW